MLFGRSIQHSPLVKAAIQTTYGAVAAKLCSVVYCSDVAPLRNAVILANGWGRRGKDSAQWLTVVSPITNAIDFATALGLLRISGWRVGITVLFLRSWTLL